MCSDTFNSVCYLWPCLCKTALNPLSLLWPVDVGLFEVFREEVDKILKDHGIGKKTGTREELSPGSAMIVLNSRAR